MMTRKILFTDLDGTLLDGKQEVGSVTYRALATFAAAGHHIVLSSGRDLNSIGDVRADCGLTFPRMYLIAYNGGLIYDCDRGGVIHRMTMKKSDAIHIIRTATAMGIHCHTYSDTHIIATARTDELDKYTSIIRTPVTITDDLEAALTEDPNKCLGVHFRSRLLLEKLRDRLMADMDSVAYAFSTPYFLDMLPAASGKGTALIKLCAMLGIPPADAIAAGDGENDLTMLEAAGTAIAMCSGVDALKEIADIVTGHDNDHDGLGRALSQFMGEFDDA